MLERTLITLTTDYGLKDSFVGMTKGVIMGINPNARIIDITHNIERHNIYEASQVIGMSYKYFPPATIHVAVVDPGVGGERRPILVVTENYYFVGPDNGIFTRIFEKENNHFFKVLHITSSHFFLQASGATFHGRDVFAPVAAWLSKGVDTLKFGERIEDFVRLALPKPVLTGDNFLTGEIVTFDHFGNAISNITLDDLTRLAPPGSREKFRIMCKDSHCPFLEYYSEAKGRELSATINGFGHLEFFVNQGSTAEAFNIKIGDPVNITLHN